jgi:hypothetical protein
VTLPTTERDEIFHCVALFCVTDIARRFDMVNVMPAAKFFDVFGFGTATVLATGLVSHTHCMFFLRGEPLTIDNITATPTGVTLASDGFRQPFAGTFF